MEIYFQSNKDAKIYESDEKIQKIHGADVAKKIKVRLAELKAAEYLSNISHLPPSRLHQLNGDRKGQFAVTLNGPCRLIFRPTHPVPKNDEGGIDLSKVTAIDFIEVANYHD